MSYMKQWTPLFMSRSLSIASQARLWSQTLPLSGVSCTHTTI